MGSWKIGNVKVEEIPDVDPKVYRDRIKDAFYDGRYREAIQEVKMALKYCNNDIADHMWMTRILYRMQEYKQCLEYIRQNKMVDYFFTEEYHYNSYMGTPQIETFFDSYLECWKHVGGSIDEADVIVVISDGTGMVKSLQDAIDMACKCHRIYCYSRPDRGGNGDVTGIVEGKDLSIIISLYEEERMRKYSPLIIVNGGNVHFINSEFSFTEYNVGVEINGGNVLFENVKFRDSLIKPGCTAIGVYVKNQATVNMKHCSHDLTGDTDRIIALYAECGNIDIRDSQLKYIVVIEKKERAVSIC